MGNVNLLPKHTQNAILVNVIDESSRFALEHAIDQIGAIISSLAGQQIFLNLPPLGICGESDEIVRFSISRNDRHCVLVLLLPESLTVGKARRNDHLLANVILNLLLIDCTICVDNIQTLESLKFFCPELGL